MKLRYKIILIIAFFFYTREIYLGAYDAGFIEGAKKGWRAGWTQRVHGGILDFSKEDLVKLKDIKDYMFDKLEWLVKNTKFNR